MAERLLSQMRRTLQVTCIGTPGNGKTSLINMMTGQQVLPGLSYGKVVDLAYGPAAHTCIEYDDGTRVDEDGICTTHKNQESIFKVRFEIPDDALKNQCFTEIRLSSDLSATDPLLTYLARSSSITIWCSPVFAAEEQSVWYSLPDHVKDNAFLALTMADRQIMKNKLDAIIERLEDFVADEFLGVFPVATLQAMQARRNASDEFNELWMLSGGADLCGAIERQVILGRTEDTDRANSLLETLNIPEHQEAEGSQSMVLRAEPLTESECQRKSSSPPSENVSAAYRRCLDALTRSAEVMIHEADEAGAFDCTRVLETCLNTVQALIQDLADIPGNDPSIERLLCDMHDSENMLLLFQIETTAVAAEDAISLMLQLKKEVSQCTAT
ncbi:MAG: hypothetical protein AAGA28_10690 [Pseudomonadota bacterium]